MPSTTHLHINSFLDHLTFQKRFSQHTVIAYKTDLEQFFAYLDSQYDSPPLTQIKTSFIRSWLAEMRSENISPKTLNRKISALRSFFKFHLKMGELTASPMGAIVAPKTPKRLPAFIDEKGMAQLLKSELTTDDWDSKTTRLIIEVFYATGIRLSELVNLQEQHIDAYNNQIKVLGKGNKERIIPISAALLKSMQAYMAHKASLERTVHTGNFFIRESGKQLYQRYVYTVVKQALSQPGITTITKRSPHVLRHTFATHLSNGGAELNAIKELLGHSSLAATQLYTHNTIEKLKDVFKKAHPKA